MYPLQKLTDSYLFKVRNKKKYYDLQDLSPKDFLRKNDSTYKELKLNNFAGNNDELCKIISTHPRILERPIILPSGIYATCAFPKNGIR